MSIVLKNDFNAVNSKSAIAAKTDGEAIKSWLHEYMNNYNTYTSYSGEVKKFTLWLGGQNVSLGDLKKENIYEYIDWLKNPPSQYVVGKIKTQKQVFKRGLSYKSVIYNIRVINSLLNYLQSVEYIYKNPIQFIKQFSKFKDNEEAKLDIQARILEDAEFELVVEALQVLDESNYKMQHKKIRTQVIVSMLYYLGLRVSELASARWNDFKAVQDRVWFFVIGKGDKKAKIPVSQEMLSIIKKYRVFLDLPDDICSFKDEYIFKSNSNLYLSTKRIRSLVKEVFKLAAYKTDDQIIKDKLLNATPHDFRHLLASNLDRLGASIVDVKEILRHSSEKTTEIYKHSKDASKFDCVEANSVAIDKVINIGAKRDMVVRVIIPAEYDLGFSLKYLLNSIRENFLSRYKYKVYESDDQTCNRFLSNAKISSDFEIQYKLLEVVDDYKKNNLIKLISQAAVARGFNNSRVYVDED